MVDEQKQFIFLPVPGLQGKKKMSRKSTLLLYRAVVHYRVKVTALFVSGLEKKQNEGHRSIVKSTRIRVLQREIFRKSPFFDSDMFKSATSLISSYIFGHISVQYLCFTFHE